MKLKNKVALITGSSRGIGRAIAIAFAKEGAKIIINYVKAKDEAEKVAEQIKKLGSESIIIKCNVGNEEEVKQMISQTIKKFGKLDILVNNAGIVYDIPFSEKTSEQIRETIDVNLLGPIWCAKHAEKYLKKAGSSVINISSTNGIDTLSPDSAEYDATKAGIISLTKNLAAILAPARVNSIAPGWINTEINKDLPEEMLEEEKNRILMKRFGNPEEIASVAVFLASDDSSFITRSIIVADGGYV